SEPVPDGDHHRADPVADHRGGGVLAVDVTEDHAAAVDEVDAGQLPRRTDPPVDPHGDLAVRPGNGPVHLDHVRILGHLRPGEQTGDPLPPPDDVGDAVEAAVDHFEQHVQRAAALGVDQVASRHQEPPGGVVTAP